jgi:uncharacterized iron-regulated membrane protein
MALSQRGLRIWGLVHKWTSLIATLFLLLLCVTGLPLIFHHEIDALTRAPKLEEHVAASAVPDYARMVVAATATHAGHVPLYLSWDEDPDHPVVTAFTAPAVDAPDDQLRTTLVDTRSGQKLDAPPADEGVMAFLFDLHASLLLGLPGTLLLGLIALVFIVAIVSGVVVYAPFMRRLAFGTVRKDRSRRVRWLDTHNMVGIVSLAWVSVVAVTGFILAMETPITLLWQSDQLAELTAPYAGQKPPLTLLPVDRALQTARAAAPQSTPSLVAWPGTKFSSSHHYLVALRGNTPLTKKLVQVALVDAQTAELTALRDTPWYVTAAFLSVPLHFGDYGGLPMKIVWALLDLALIAVLVTGLYLWLKRHE